MCIIAYSKDGVVIPKKTVLKRCWRNNSDGAGFAYLTNDLTWHIQKGFETWKAFWKAFNQHQFTKEDTVIIHFRVGTSGKKHNGKTNHPDCTHPFPGTNDEELLMAHDIVTDTIFVHNGVCGTGEGDLSDTMVAIRDYGSALIPYIEDVRILNIMGQLLLTNKCRWFVSNKDKGWLLGDWVEDKDTGIMYSNKGYEKPQVVATKYPTQGAYRGGMWGGWQNSTHHGNMGSKDTDQTTHCIYYANSAKLYCDENRIWSWDKWLEFDQCWNRDELNKSTKEDDIKVIEVFTVTGEPLGIIDEGGDVVWLDAYEDQQEDKRLEQEAMDTAYSHLEDSLPEYPREIQVLIDQHGADFRFDCTRCGNELSLKYLTVNGECPWCWEVLIPVLEEEPNTRETCPSCGERNYIIDPKYGASDEPTEEVGDATSECCRCGCMWKGTDTILGYNRHTRDAYIYALDAQGGVL